MKWFMFGVTVLFGLLAIGSTITAVVLLVFGNIIGAVIALIAAVACTFMAASVAKSMREYVSAS